MDCTGLRSICIKNEEKWQEFVDTTNYIYTDDEHQIDWRVGKPTEYPVVLVYYVDRERHYHTIPGRYIHMSDFD